MRSLLFIPAKEKMLNKIAELSADAYIIDLEDSIPEEDKEKALELLCLWLSDTKEGRTLEYRVYDKYVVEPTDVTCTTQRTNGMKEITLITCTNYDETTQTIYILELTSIE